MEPRLTVADLSAKSSLSECTIVREIKRGNLRAVKVCGKWLIKESHADLWLSFPNTRSAGVEGKVASRVRAGAAKTSTAHTIGGLR